MSRSSSVFITVCYFPYKKITALLYSYSFLKGVASADRLVHLRLVLVHLRPAHECILPLSLCPPVLPLICSSLSDSPRDMRPPVLLLICSSLSDSPRGRHTPSGPSFNLFLSLRLFARATHESQDERLRTSIPPVKHTCNLQHVCETH
jgi:hypothetical protein